MPSQEFLLRPGSIWEVYPFADKPLEQVRREMEELAVRDCRGGRGVHWEPGSCGDVPGKWVFPREDCRRVLLYFHGGGFTLGSSGLSLPFLTELAQALHLTAFSADYRLAPEHPFPAAVEDALAAYRGLLEMGYHGDEIVLAGESAGATLCLVLALQCRDRQLPPPRAVVAMSPAVDFTAPQNDKVLDALPGMAEVLGLYAPDADPADPRISPVLGDLRDLCPVFTVAGGAEALLPDALKLTQALTQAGGEAMLLVGRDMPHTYPLEFTDYPEAAEAFGQIAGYIRIKLGLED